LTCDRGGKRWKKEIYEEKEEAEEEQDEKQEEAV